MRSVRHLLPQLRSRPRAHLALAFVVVVNHFSAVGLAAAPAAASVTTTSTSPVAAVCTHFTGHDKCASSTGNTLQLTVPSGLSSCPGSGQGAACASNDSDRPDAGVASTPGGSTACSAAQGAPSTVASCSDTVLQAPQPSGSKGGGSVAAPVVLPSVPNPVGPDATLHYVELVVDRTSAVPGGNVVLTATADGTVAGTGSAIEIFDTTTQKLAGACLSGGQCSVAYAAHTGVHTFEAFITGPTTEVPAATSVISSNKVDVSWIGIKFAGSARIVGPGQPITLTASSTIPIDKTGWLLQLYDVNSHARLTYCATGNTCSTALSQPNGGSHSYVAVLAPPADRAPDINNVVAQTDVVTATWLSVAVYATSNSAAAGGVVHVVATSNADLTRTPWYLGIFDSHDQLVAPICKNGNQCTADVTITDSMPSFKAAIGDIPASGGGTLGTLLQRVTGPAKLVNIQAQSGLVKPSVHTSRALWGVDSCKSFTSGLYTQVYAQLGAPDFWGRYLTQTVCPAISGDEVAAAHNMNMGILPIYDDYDCSNVVGYSTGVQYGNEAVAAAQSLRIPQGVGIVIDIEPPGDACPGAANVDPGFITGWYDSVMSANYVPVYYGNGSPGSEFANAWCAAVTARPDVADNSHIWTFESSLWGGYSKGNRPDWNGAYSTQCPEHGTAWQYMLSAGSDPDVDQDLLSSALPLWYP